MRKGGEVSNYERVIRENCRQIRNLFTLNLTAKSFSRQLQLLVKLGVKEV
jgi:hypothetical protein